MAEQVTIHCQSRATVLLREYACSSEELTREAVCSRRRHVVEHKRRGVVPFVLCSEVCYFARPAQDATIVQSRLRVRFALKTKTKVQQQQQQQRERERETMHLHTSVQAL